MTLDWILKPFSQLTTDELYALLKLRNEVFIVEQTCPFPDLDGRDQLSLHLLGWLRDEARLVAYTRLLPPGVAYEAHASIGRVVTDAAVRGRGTGRELMRRSIEAIEKNYGAGAIKIGAQLYLKEFYKSFGFNQQGEPYLEDGIQHIYMLRE